MIKAINQLWVLPATVAGMLGCSTTHAQESDWQYSASVYLWGASADIETEAGSDVEIRFSDIAKDLKLGGMLTTTAQRDKWLLLADMIYLDMDDNVKDSVLPGVELNDLGLEAWIVTPMAGYQLLNSGKHTLYAMAGARYLWIDIAMKTDISAPFATDSVKSSVSKGSWDGIVGFHGDWKLHEKWYASYHLDAGAGDSDFTWQAVTTVGYRFENFDAKFGYRYIDWNDTENDALTDLNFGGFIGGVTFHF